MFHYRILTTGSKGNAVLVENTLIDAGITKKKLMQLGVLSQIETVFVSHRHADHCNLPLLRYLIKEGKQVCIPQGVIAKLNKEGKINVAEYDNIQEIEANSVIESGSLSVQCIAQKHYDIINYAFVITKEGQRLLYATDLDTLSASDLGDGLYHLAPFDLIFLEGNYDEEWLREYIIESISSIEEHFDFNQLTSDELDKWVRGNYNKIPKDMASSLIRAVQNMRHLSKQQARAYVKKYLKPGGKYYEIHRSSLFYERPSDWDVVTSIQ